CQQETNWPLTF
nr:immunoglobulin light chain junction region [Macaca mulatta]MOW33990.1 immunoglobulin light chain junction region [Macaca mulatta]MOW34934.1 immunoglobulin light chain junction region [Macaca mulatta]MOX24315.1 immunoglobulin light chain junction region [Macaca mulatta]MOX24320.1 immunoglobulin light chain junction region [Macaca mulatta]